MDEDVHMTSEDSGLPSEHRSKQIPKVFITPEVKCSLIVTLSSTLEKQHILLSLSQAFSVEYCQQICFKY